MSDNWYEAGTGEIVVINDSGVPEDDISKALTQQYPPGTVGIDPTALHAQKVMTAWLQNVRGRRGGIFQRDAYVAPRRIFDQFDTAERALESDDIVSGVYETTEALAFSQMHLECKDEDETDVWDQIFEDLDLDARLREMWHDLFQFSNLYYGVYWGEKEYKVRGETKAGNKKRKLFPKMKVPLGITLLDPRKIIPAGNFMFNKESLVYLASEAEADRFNSVINSNNGRGDGLNTDDPIVTQLILKEVEQEFVGSRNYLNELGYQHSNFTKFYLLNPANVFRHTLTRPQYKAIANVRMRSVFDLLDLKNQLKEMDRANLLGATNWILLIKKGSDAQPGTRNEIQSLSNYVQQSARVPVIVSDHRLEIEIITPKTDHTLSAEKYDIIDTRISQRLFQMFVNPGGGRKEDSMKLARVIAAGMENRRDGLKRSFERNVLRPTVKQNDSFTSDPTLVFNPRHIALDFDLNLANFLLDLRDRGELSRETLLAEFNYDQSEEAWKRVIEKEKYDKVFETSVPFSTGRPTPLQQEGQPVPVTIQDPSGAPAKAPAKTPAKTADPKQAGRNQGGNRNGGGSGTPSPKRGKTKTQQA